MTTTSSAQAIIDFWFSDSCKACWFNSTPELDQLIKQNYESLWLLASQGKLKQWREDPISALALVIILDQFPLNMFRGTAQSFATESASRDVARYAIEKGFDKSLSNEQKKFLYMPFMHSEDMTDQDYSVVLFKSAGLNDNARWAEHHRDIVKRFGRFPHRNEILGRESSAEEIQWLASAEAFQG
jgi:uncharacterized protein (DUF924 family)